MSIDRSLLQQVKQAMHKLAAPVPPEEVTAPKPYAKPQYLEPQQPSVDAGPDVIPGSPDPEKKYEAFKTPQQKAIDEYNDYISKSFSDFIKLPYTQLKPGIEGFDFKKNMPDILAGTGAAPIAAQIPPIRALMNKHIDDYKSYAEMHNGKPVNQGYSYWQKPYTGNLITDMFQGMLNSRTNATHPWLDESQNIMNELKAVRSIEESDMARLLGNESVEKRYGRGGEAARLYLRAFPQLSSKDIEDLIGQYYDLRTNIATLNDEGREKFNLTPEQDFTANPEAQSYYEEKVHPLQIKVNALDALIHNAKYNSSTSDIISDKLGITDNARFLKYPQSVGNDYGALSDSDKKIKYTRQGNAIGEKLKNAPWAQIGRAAAISSKPLLGYLTPGKPAVSESLPTRLGRVAAQEPAVSESLPTRLGRVAAQEPTQTLTAFPYADRGYGGFYPRVDPNKPATKPNIPYSPASHMDAGPPMLDRRFSRMDVDAAKPEKFQPTKTQAAELNLPAIPSESPITRRLSGGRGY